MCGKCLLNEMSVVLGKPPHGEFDCKDCQADTSQAGLKEYYMVDQGLWNSVAGPKDILCIGCLEKRLGHKLKPKDFEGYQVNRIFKHSARLNSRMCGCH